MSNLFQRVEDAVNKIENGWCSVAKAQTLASCVIALRPNVCVEIGVWGGRSAIPIALALKEIGHGVLYAVDPWDSHASAEGQIGEDLKWWSSVAPHEDVYQQFCKHVNLFAVQNSINIVRKRSDDFEIPAIIDFAHIDGNHSEQAIKDATRIGKNMRVGGLLVMDDYEWAGGGVNRAVATIKTMGFKELYRLGTGGVLQKVL